MRQSYSDRVFQFVFSQMPLSPGYLELPVLVVWWWGLTPPPPLLLSFKEL